MSHISQLQSVIVPRFMSIRYLARKLVAMPDLAAANCQLLQFKSLLWLLSTARYFCIARHYLPSLPHTFVDFSVAIIKLICLCSYFPVSLKNYLLLKLFCVSFLASASYETSSGSGTTWRHSMLPNGPSKLGLHKDDSAWWTTGDLRYQGQTSSRDNSASPGKSSWGAVLVLFRGRHHNNLFYHCYVWWLNSHQAGWEVSHVVMFTFEYWLPPKYQEVDTCQVTPPKEE